MEKKLEEAEIKKLENEKELPNTIEKQQNVSFSEQKRAQSEKRKKERQISKIETSIEQYEEKIHNLELKMTQPDIFQDHEKLLELTNETNELKAILDKLMDEWTELHA